MDTTENIINEVLAEQTAVAEVVETPEDNSQDVEEVAEVEAPEAEVAEEAEVEFTDKTEEEVAEYDELEEKWPKKAENALAKQKKQTNKYRHQADEMKREIELLKQQVADRPESKEAPKEDDYETVVDYLKAEAKFQAVNGIQEAQNQQTDAKLQNLEETQKVAYVQERQAHVVSKVAEAVQSIPDFNAVCDPYSDLIDSFSPELEQAFMQIEDAPTAFYNMAKEGKLEQLSYMPIEMARIEIVQAQYRSHSPAQVKKKTVSSAPTPIKGAKGTGAKSKRLDDMDGDAAYRFMTT